MTFCTWLSKSHSCVKVVLFSSSTAAGCILFFPGKLATRKKFHQVDKFGKLGKDRFLRCDYTMTLERITSLRCDCTNHDHLVKIWDFVFKLAKKLYQNSLNWSSFVDLSHYGRLVHVNAVIFQGCIGLDISLIRLSLSYTGFWATTILLNYLTICLPSWPILIFCKRNEVSINTAQKLLQ